MYFAGSVARTSFATSIGLEVVLDILISFINPPATISVAGGLSYTKKVVGDVTDITLPHGIYKIHSEISNLIGLPPGVSYGALIRIVVDKFYFNIAIDIYQNKIYLSCYTKDNWNPWREL